MSTSVNLFSQSKGTTILQSPASGNRAISQEVLDAGLHEPVSEFLSRPGKRIRADLIRFAFQAAGGNGTPPSNLFEFLELLHAGSLIIDDIEDDSEFRRGRPAMHRTHGVPIAINSGNWMYFSALEKLQYLPLSGTEMAEVNSLCLRVIRRCHEGQAMDLAARIDQLHRLEVGIIAGRITELKTGGLTALAARLGAIVAGANASTCAAISEFGMHLGVGLQMQNDLAELVGGRRFGGRMDDLRNGRVTWPWAWLAEARNDSEFAELQGRWKSCDQNALVNLAIEMIDGTADVGRQRIHERICVATDLLHREFGVASCEQLASIIERLEHTNV